MALHSAPLPTFKLYRGVCHPVVARLRLLGASGNFHESQACRHICNAKLTKKVREEAELAALGADDFRPWKFEIPDMDQILADEDWPFKVRNWETFWGIFLNWLQAWGDLVLLERGDEDEMSISKEDLAWLQVYPGQRDKVEAVIDKVVAALPQLQLNGYPVPESLPGKKPWHIGHWKMRYFQDHMGRRRWEKAEIVGVNPLWGSSEAAPDEEILAEPVASIDTRFDDWNEWDFRAYMEKRRAHRRAQADFARRQAEVGKFDHVTVSHLTDSRMAVEAPFYPHITRDPTHEECLARVRMYGKAVDPETIAIRIQDPLEAADGFEEGVRYVPDTLEFLASIGHLTENEEDLIGVSEGEVPSATMEEEFPEETTAFDNEDEDDLEGFQDVDSDEMDEADAIEPEE